MSPRVAVRPSDDPYKKYWWLILVGFGVTAAWLCLPMMEGSVGSTRVDTSAPAQGIPSGEGSLDPSDNPNGAPGSTLDLSMDIADRRKKGGDGMASSLYQAPAEETAVVEAPTAGAAASGGSLASALAKAAVSSDPKGWGGQKAQKGFTQPKLGGSMPGLGGGASGGSAPSAGGGTAAFGARNSQVGYAGTRGLSGSVGDMPAAKNVKGALARAAAQTTAAANLRCGDGQVAGMSAVFDGRGSRSGSAIGPGGEALGSGGVYEGLDAAPANLKMNDPNLDSKEFKEVPAQVANTKDNSSDEFKQQIAMMVVTTVVGGLVGGAVGGMVSTMGTQLSQMWQTQERNRSQLNQEQPPPPRT